MYDLDYLDCQCCQRMLPRHHFPAWPVQIPYQRWCTKCIQSDQFHRAEAARATATPRDTPEVWEHRDAVLAARKVAEEVPTDALSIGHLTTLARAALVSSDDVPPLLDEIANLRRALARVA